MSAGTLFVAGELVFRVLSKQEPEFRRSVYQGRTGREPTWIGVRERQASDAWEEISERIEFAVLERATRWCALAATDGAVDPTFPDDEDEALQQADTIYTVNRELGGKTP